MRLNILLISTCEGGFQPLIIASATTPFLEAEFDVFFLDTYVDGIREELFVDPDLVGISIPLFDALHPGIEIAARIRQANPKAHITFFGQYATINSMRLAKKYGDSCITGEWEEPLLSPAQFLDGDGSITLSGIDAEKIEQGLFVHPYISRKHFRVQTRSLLPSLNKYPQTQIDKLCGSKQLAANWRISLWNWPALWA
jgi:hypothetical protein